MKFFMYLFIFILPFLMFPVGAWAQLQTDSNVVETQIGNPQVSRPPVSSASVPCPIPGGTVSCGPYKPASTCSQYGCAHCDPSCYSIGPWCASDIGSHYAADIPGAGNQETLLPSITYPSSGESHTITCLLYGVGEGTSTPGQKILIFSCKDDVTSGTVYMQFHHMSPDALPQQGVEYRTGDVIGRLDPRDGPHAHVQIGINGGCGSNGSDGCVPADKYLQCN